jgi:hypothetical protein
MNPKGASRRRALIEMLESRRLLSVAPASAAAMRVGAPAVHTHPTPPNLLGVYDGGFTGTSLGFPANGDLEFDFTSESKAGRLSGSAAVPVVRYAVSGSINVKGKFSLHGSRPNETLKVTGTASTDRTILTGSFIVKLKHTHAVFQGTYTLSLSSRI